jgi:hypothetical protein
MHVDDVLELSKYKALRAECRTKEQKKLLDERVDGVLDALANAGAYRGKAQKLYLQIAKNYCELATLAPRTRKSAPVSGAAVDGAAASSH